MSSNDAAHGVERAVLGAMVLYGDARHVLAMSARGLTADMFVVELHRQVFTAMLSLADRSAAVDAMTVSAELDRLGLCRDQPGVVEMVEMLASFTPVAGNVGDYADRLIELAQWRTWGKAARAAVDAADRHDMRAFAEAQTLFSSQLGGGDTSRHLQSGPMGCGSVRSLRGPTGDGANSRDPVTVQDDQ